MTGFSPQHAPINKTATLGLWVERRVRPISNLSWLAKLFPVRSECSRSEKQCDEGIDRWVTQAETARSGKVDVLIRPAKVLGHDNESEDS